MFLSGLAACQTAPEIPFRHIESKSVSPQFLVQALQERQNEVHNLRSYVKTTVIRKKFKQTMAQIILVQGHHSIRLDILNLFKRPVGVFIHDDTKTLLYLPEENRLFSGWEVWDIMEKMLGTVIDFGEYISVFSGSIPRLEYLDFGMMVLDPGKNFYQIEAVDSATSEKIHIDMDARTLLPVRMIKRTFDRISYIAQWENYKMVDGRPFAHRVVISRPSRGESLIIKYSNPLINKGIPAGGFDLAVRKTQKASVKK